MPELKRLRRRKDQSDADDSSASSLEDSRHRRRRIDDRRRRHKSKSRKSDKYDDSSVGSSSSNSSYKERRRARKKRRKKKKKNKRNQKTESRRKSLDLSSSSADLEISHARPAANATDREENQGEIMVMEVKETPRQSSTEPKAKSRNMAPMTFEQHQALQSQVREVYDPESGRMRLVRGTGEIIERIVSRADHHTINRQATTGDGAFFARNVASRAARDFSKRRPENS